MTEPPARILLVDDVPENIRLLEAVLGPEGYELLAAGSGAQALRLVATSDPDLVLLDLRMPDMDGHEVCRRLRADASTRALPVLMITAAGDREKVSALESGADDFVAKPFDPGELLARVRSLVRIKRSQDTIQAQADRLADLNQTLEARVREQVDEIERLGRLRRFLSPAVADLLVSAEGEPLLENHRAEIAVVCANLRGFAQLSERAEPEEAMRVLGEWHEGIGRLVHRFGATVASLEADRLLAFLNDPLPCESPAWRAAALALAMRQRADALATRWRRRGHDLQFAAGVSLGFATLGGMGFEGRWEYGPVGPVVHQATELAGEAGPGEVLMSLRARAAADRLVTAEQTRELVRDGLGPAPAFAVTGVEGGGSEPGDLSPREIEVLRLLSEGLSNRGIAARLVISEKTAIRHVSNIFAKLGVHTRAAATREAVTRGIAEESPPSG